MGRWPVSASVTRKWRHSPVTTRSLVTASPGRHLEGGAREGPTDSPLTSTPSCSQSQSPRSSKRGFLIKLEPAGSYATVCWVETRPAGSSRTDPSRAGDRTLLRLASRPQLAARRWRAGLWAGKEEGRPAALRGLGRASGCRQHVPSVGPGRGVGWGV